MILFEFFWAKLLVFVSEREKWVIRSKKTSDSLICSIVLSDLSKSLRSVFYPEQPEQNAHICSFVLSHLSEWANEWWANEQITNPDN